VSRLDWKDDAAWTLWLANLRASLDDADAVSLDMLRPPRARELGPAMHAEKYRDAWTRIEQAMADAGAPDPYAGGEGGPTPERAA
jgi:hypothetical protein